MAGNSEDHCAGTTCERDHTVRDGTVHGRKAFAHLVEIVTISNAWIVAKILESRMYPCSQHDPIGALNGLFCGKRAQRWIAWSQSDDDDLWLRRRHAFDAALSPARLSTARKASWGISTFPTSFMRALPSFCFSSSLRFRVMSPP